MQNWPLQLRLFTSPRFIPLRYRVVLANTVMLILLLGALIIALVWFQNHNYRQQLEERGKAIAQSLVATSTRALLNYDYITLEQFANQAAQAPNILYVIVHDKEHRVAGFSNRPDLQGTKLFDELSRDAVSANGPLVQVLDAELQAEPGLEVALPVILHSSGSRWGTIRVGLSLTSMYRQIEQTIWIITGIGFVTLIIGTMISLLGTQRVTRPLGELVSATMEVARGNFIPNKKIRTGDEVEVLAANFAVMTKEILNHQESKERQLKEIQRLQNYTEKLMTTMADGLLSVDMRGNIVTINPAAIMLLGLYSQDTMKGKHIGDILGESSQFAILVDKIIQRPDVVIHREIEIRKESQTQTILLSSSILQDDQGRPLEIIFNLHDITELKQMEADIRQSERLAGLGTLAAGMAHEIRNPLSAIKTFVQLLPRKVDTPGFLEKFNRTVPRETERINILVEELLELSRVPKYAFTAVDINDLLKECIDAVTEELQQNHISCQVELQDNLPQVMADPNQLVKAFSNLIRNGIQAMSVEGTLTISTIFEESTVIRTPGAAQTKGQVIITFLDTGHGIDSRELEQIFNPFFTTKDSGTGLGLPITHKVITEHTGQIHAESEKGKGAKFTIQLPVVEKISFQRPSFNPKES